MLVTVDIGNTNITIGIFDKEDLIGTYRLTTKEEERVMNMVLC